MAEARKAMARIQVPPKRESVAGSAETIGVQTSGCESAEIQSELTRSVPLPMSRTTPRDPLIVPLVGLLLAFSVISFIVQLLMAFSWE